MRGCRSSHKVRKAVVDSHKPLRPTPPPPPDDHALEMTTTKTVQVFGGLPHRLPKPQQFTAGQPMPLPPDPQPGNNEDQSTPNRSRNPPPPPPPPPFSSPSSSGQCSPSCQVPEPCKPIFDQEHPGSPAAHIDPPPCTSSSSSSTSSESTTGSASPLTWYCNPNSATKPIATPAAPAMNAVIADDVHAVFPGCRDRSTSCGILSPPSGFQFIAPKSSLSAVPEPAMSESSSSASTAGIADIRCGDDVQVFRLEEIEKAWRSKFSPDRRVADQVMGDDVSVFRAWMIDRGGLNKSMVMIVREQCRSLQVINLLPPNYDLLCIDISDLRRPQICSALRWNIKHVRQIESRTSPYLVMGIRSAYLFINSLTQHSATNVPTQHEFLRERL